MTAEAITLGCRLNFAESEMLKAQAPDNAIIVNSCAVTGEAVRQTRQAIRRARRDRPEARIIVTGCAAQLDPPASPPCRKWIGPRQCAKGLQDPFVLSEGREAAEVEGRPAPTFEKRFDFAGRTGVWGWHPSCAQLRIHSTVAAASASGCAASSRPDWLRPSLHLLHHLAGARAAVPALRGDPRRHRAGTRQRRREIVLTGVDITSYEGGLGRFAKGCSPPSQSQAPAPVLARQRRNGRGFARLAPRAAADAAFPLSRRPATTSPEAHEAPPQARAGGDLVERIKQRGPTRPRRRLIAGFPTESERRH